MEWPSRDRRNTSPGPYSKMSASRPDARRGPGLRIGSKATRCASSGSGSHERHAPDGGGGAANTDHQAAQGVQHGLVPMPRVEEVDRLPAGGRPRRIAPAQPDTDDGQHPSPEAVIERQPREQAEEERARTVDQQ